MIPVNILAINNGISAGWTSPVQPTLEQPNNPIQTDPILKDEFSKAASMLYLGGFLGLFVWNDFTDRFGRKINGYILALTQIIAWLGVIFARHPHHLILARIIMGFGGTGIMTNSQLYINETADPGIRGYLCSLLTIGMNFGFVLVYLLGSLLPYSTLNYFCFFVPVLFLFLYWWLPESPLYLIASGRSTKAKSTFLWFNGNADQAAEHSLTAMRKSITTKEKNVPYSVLISTKENALLTLVAMILLSGMQLCGMPIISAYTVEIFHSFGNENLSYRAAVLLGVAQLFSSCISSPAMKYGGKKLLLSGSYFGAFLSLLSLSLCFYVQDKVKLDPILPLLSMILMAVCFGCGIGTVPYIVLGDMVPPHILNNVVSVALMSAILISFAVLSIFFRLVSIFGNTITFAIFAANNLFLALFVIFAVPRTKEIDSVEPGCCKNPKISMCINGTDPQEIGCKNLR